MSPLSAFSDTFKLGKNIKPQIEEATKVTSTEATYNNSSKMVETHKKPYTEHTDSELAELATQEISLDLQGLIDDTQFTEDNLFGDLMETAKKNDSSAPTHHQHQHWLGQGTNTTANVRGSTPTSGSSGQNSPGGGSEGHSSPLQAGYGGGGGAAGYARNTLAYLPGSVHAAGFNQINHHGQNVQVKLCFHLKCNINQFLNFIYIV